MGNTIPNKVDGTLKFETEIAQESEDKVGKHPIIAKDVTTVDIPSSEVVADWEERNDKAVTVIRGDVWIEPDIRPDTDLLGKTVRDLQSRDTTISANNVLGTLHYVSDYTGFSGDPEEQEGNYFAFIAGYDGECTKLTAQGGTAPEVEIDPSDHTHVMRVARKAPLVIRAYNGDVVVASKTFDISQLVLEPKDDGSLT